MAMQSPSSSSSFSYGFTYQVFLSFRGTDTRYGFTGNLYKALIDKGIHTFIDDNDLQRGDEITPSLIKAIEESRIFIPVFSINYASSKFCLDELVHIIHCYKTKGRLVLPVFFGVDPTNVRHHTCSYGEALAEHEKRFQNDKDNMERLERWKLALTQAANLSGYHDSPPRYEYKLIGEIVKYISNKINRQPLHVANYPVGLQSRVQEVKSLLDEGPDDGVHMVGIYGIGGLGKSALARAIYNFVADQFEGLCFLHDVRENSAQNNLKHLQEKLLLKTTGLKIKLDHVCEGIPIIKERLCRNKILLILDDVDDMEQLHALAGGPDWFGHGSRVIITTRDKHLLTSHDIERTYAVEGLYGTEALELLRWMAFKNNKVPSSYEDILNRAVSYASGLPLVLEIVGSNLFGKSIKEWKGTLDGYEKIPNKKIHEILKVSYDALEEEQQSVFLDIACCFKGCGWEEFEDILHVHYGHCITHHLGVLAEKSLIKISTCYHSGSIDVVRVHDLIKDMGKEVVRQESPKDPEKRSRLWRHEDIVHVIKENIGTSKIEMINMNFHSMESVIDQKGKAFKKMTKLRTLIIENGHFSEGLKYLPSSLIVLKWKGCLSESLSSSILSKNFQNMKVLTLDDNEYLTHIPDLSGLQNLEKFSFKYCENLITIDNSIGHLNKLERLSAFGCSKLEHFPPLGLASLKELNLCCCDSLKSFPKLLCEMTNIDCIWLNYSPIGELPSSFQNLSELDELSVRECGMLNDKMYSIMFSNVTELSLKDCNLSDEYLQIVLKWCVNVEELELSNNNFKILPECLSECHHLKHLDLSYCTSLEEIRGIPPNLKELSAYQCKSLSSSSRRMLMSQQLHEAQWTYFVFPNGTEGIPDWFEHQSKGPTISFWFRKEIPSITCIFILPEGKNGVADSGVNYFVNGYEIELDGSFYQFSYVYLKQTSLFHTLKWNELSGRQYDYDIMDKVLSKNEWIHVELKLDDSSLNRLSEEEMNKILRSAQIGIHVLMEKSNTEENVVFTNPYIRKTKSDEYLNASLSLSQEKMKRKKFSIRINLRRKIWVLLKFRARFRKQKEHRS